MRLEECQQICKRNRDNQVYNTLAGSANSPQEEWCAPSLRPGGNSQNGFESQDWLAPNLEWDADFEIVEVE